MIASLLFALLMQTPVAQQSSLQQTRDEIISARPEDLPSLFTQLAKSKEASEKDVKILIPFLEDQRPVVTTVLISDNVQVSRFAAEALVEIGKAAVPRLITVLKESNVKDTRIITLNTLYQISIPSDSAQQAIEDVVSKSNDDPYLLESSIYALGTSSPDIERAVQTLIKVPSDSSFIARIAVARTLGDIGRGFPASTKKLLELTKDMNNRVQLNAIESLAKVASKSDIDVISRLRNFCEPTSQPELRRVALAAIKQVEARTKAKKVKGETKVGKEPEG